MSPLISDNSPGQTRAAIVDYGLGNLYSVKRACEHVGMQADITASKDEILHADVVILPGVGAFGDAMASLRRLDLIEPLRDIAASGKPLVGVCLGMQLLMTESCEFGLHKGLGIIEGSVVRFESPQDSARTLKVPQVGWNRVFPLVTPPGSPFPRGGRLLPPLAKGEPGGVTREGTVDHWQDSPLEGIASGEFMYFVHSYYVKPEDPGAALSASRYGDIEFCSSVRRGSVFGCQYHPERSGPWGLRIYENIAVLARRNHESKVS